MFEILEPSNLDEFYLKHHAFYKWLENLEENKSTALNKNEFDYSLIKKFIQDYNQDNKTSIVIIEHVNCFEVKRLPNGISIKYYYEFLNAKEKASIVKDESGEKILFNFIKEYLNESLELSAKYDFSNNLALMKNLKIFKKAYLSRRAGGVTFFKNSPKGASTEITDCLKSLCEKGYLKTLNKEHTLKVFNTTAECFEITTEL